MDEEVPMRAEWEDEFLPTTPGKQSQNLTCVLNAIGHFQWTLCCAGSRGAPADATTCNLLTLGARRKEPCGPVQSRLFARPGKSAWPC